MPSLELVSPVLGAFVTPSLFYGGAALSALPILIHLLARRRFKRIRWAAVEFLIDAERRNRRRVRLEEWILMVLRCLVILALGTAMARPFARPGGFAASWVGGTRAERVFLLDDSLSMNYTDGHESPFDRAQNGVRQILGVLGNTAPDDSVTVVRMSAVGAPVDVGTALEEAQFEGLMSRLSALRPTLRAVDPADAISQLARWLEDTPGLLNAVVYVLSDFQRTDWVEREVPVTSPSRSPVLGSDENATILEPLLAWGRRDHGLRVVLIDVGSDEPSNRAIIEAGLSGGPVITGAPSTLRVKVVNYSSGPIGGLTVSASVGHASQPSAVIENLAPDQTNTLDLPVEFPRAGGELVRVELPADGLPPDDVRYVAVDVASFIRVLVVNGEPSGDSYLDEVNVLKTALRPEGEVFSGNEVTVVDEGQLEETDLGPFRVVILANVYRLSDATTELLERYVRDGGGLVVFLGDQVDASYYNGALYRDGGGPLPSKLGDRVRASTPAHMVIVDRLHSAVQGMDREGDPLGIGKIPFFEYFEMSLPSGGQDRPPEGEGVGSAGETPGLTPGSADSTGGDAARGVRVVARLDDPENRPLIVERTFGGGRVVLLGTTADKEWTLWPDHPTFLPVMLELIRHTARRDSTERSTFVGEPIRWIVDAAKYEPELLVRLPSFPADPEVPLTAHSAEDGSGLSVKWDQTAEPGLYEFLLRERDGGERSRWAAVNVDPRESNLSGSDEPMLRRAFPDIPFNYFDGIEGLVTESIEGRREYWRPLMVTVILLLLVEQSLAWTWGRRR